MRPPASASDKLLLQIARCPIMEAHLEGRGGDQACGEIVLHQWAHVSQEARLRRWRREHHTPVPWVGHLASAPILFISSNPNMSANDIRKADEVDIADPEPLSELNGKRADDHPSMRKPFRAAKFYWADEEILDVYDDMFDVWVKDDGITPLSSTSRKRASVQHWEFCRDQAQEMMCDRSVRPGRDYAITEVVHCRSSKEHGVEQALAPCAERYLTSVLEVSPASVLIVVGTKAAKAFHSALDQPKREPETLAGPVSIAGRDRHLLYLPHPSWLRRHPAEARALTLPHAISPEQLRGLRKAVAATEGAAPLVELGGRAFHPPSTDTNLRAGDLALPE
jgi:hypothetical protein